MKGVLVDLCDGPLLEVPDLEAGQTMVLEAVQASNLPGQEKRRMIMNVQTAESLEGLQRYCYNAMLKFNGLGTRFR